jgi:hypothetical protein
MIDATLERPFFQRKSDGSLMYPGEAGFVSELGALDALPEEEDWNSDLEGDDEDAVKEVEAEDDNDVNLREGENDGDNIKRKSAASKREPRKRIDYRFFEQNIWPSISNPKKHRVKSVSASNVYQEIQSFIKVLTACVSTCKPSNTFEIPNLYC